MEVNLSKFDLRQLSLLADGVFRAGDIHLARELYRFLAHRAPGLSHVQARIGLTMGRNPRSDQLLDFLEVVEKIRERPFVSEGLMTWSKTLPFMDDRRFMDLAEKHSNLLPVPNWHWNLQTVVWAVRQALRVEGDFVELGVFRGHTTMFVAEYVGFADWPRKWLLYDTFDGIPEDQLDPGWEERNKAYAGTFSYEAVRDSFAPFPNIQVIKGRVPEILAETCPEKISFLHMDMNNVTAEIGALDALFDRISPGGVIVFDDYVWLAARAQYEAEKAWFEARGLTILPLPTGQGVFVKPAA